MSEVTRYLAYDCLGHEDPSKTIEIGPEDYRIVVLASDYDTLRARVEELEHTSQDANRFHWLMFDHDSKEARQARRDLLKGLSVHSYSAACADIDYLRGQYPIPEIRYTSLQQQLDTLTAELEALKAHQTSMAIDCQCMMEERDNALKDLARVTGERDCYKKACGDYEKDNEYVLNLCGGYNATTRNTWVKAVEELKAQLTAARERIQELEHCLRLHLAVAPDDPLIVEPLEQQVLRLEQRQRDMAIDCQNMMEDRDNALVKLKTVEGERVIEKVKLTAIVAHLNCHSSLEHEPHGSILEVVALVEKAAEHARRMIEHWKDLEYPKLQQQLHAAQETIAKRDYELRERAKDCAEHSQDLARSQVKLKEAQETVKRMEEQLKTLCNEVSSYTTERQYHSRDAASKDLDKREKALLKVLAKAQAALDGGKDG